MKFRNWVLTEKTPKSRFSSLLSIYESPYFLLGSFIPYYIQVTALVPWGVPNNSKWNPDWQKCLMMSAKPNPNLTSQLSNCPSCPLIVLLSQVLGESRVRLSQSLSSSDQYCNLIASCCTQSKWSSLLSSLSSPSPSSTARYRNLIADHCTPLCDFCKARKVFAKVWKPPPMCRNCSYRAKLSQTSSSSGETMWIHRKQSTPTLRIGNLAFC